MDTYVWYNAILSKYEIGSRVDFEMIVRRKSIDAKPELLYRFNRLSSRLAEKVVTELNEELEVKTV
jgi:glycine betaine/choline ABC-type transport system substrate-binding protein